MGGGPEEGQMEAHIEAYRCVIGALDLIRAAQILRTADPGKPTRERLVTQSTTQITLKQLIASMAACQGVRTTAGCLRHAAKQMRRVRLDPQRVEAHARLLSRDEAQDPST